MRRRVNNYKRVGTSRTNGYDKSDKIIYTSEHYNSGKGVRMMVTSEFDGITENILGQHKATDHKVRMEAKVGERRIHIPSMRA